jgi:CHAD domain-containing protein
MDRSAPRQFLIVRRLRTLEHALPDAAQGDARALHKARIATRRIREALPLVSAGARARRVARQVRKITRALGPVRELDVALEILDRIEVSGDVSRSALARLRQAIARERHVLQADMKRRLENVNLDKLRKRAVEAAQHAPGAPRRDPGRVAIARARAARRAERLRAAVEGASGIYLPDRLHEVRIAVKKLRYGLELVRDLNGSRASAPIKLLSHVQDTLGRMHDLEILIARTRGVQGAPGAPTLKLSGELDRLVRQWETECRQLHGKYMASRRALLGICERTIAAAARSESAA